MELVLWQPKVQTAVAATMMTCGMRLSVYMAGDHAQMPPELPATTYACKLVVEVGRQWGEGRLG